MPEAKKYMRKPFWAEGTSLTRKQIQQLSNSTYSVTLLSEARRIQIKQREEIKKLKAAIKMRGELQR